MFRYFFKRVLYGVPVLIVVATLTFIFMHLVPGGPFDTEKKLPPEIIANIEAKYHLDEPLITQYLLFLKQITQGELGPSYKYIGRDVADILKDTFPVSLVLGLCAMLVVVGVGIPIGILSAYWQNSLLDRICVLLATLGISVPSFVLRVGAKLLDERAAVLEAIEEVKREREALVDSLGKIEGVEAFPSDSNFVLFTTNKPYEEVYNRLLEKGVIIRRIGDVSGYSDCLRVSVAPREITSMFLEALREVLA